MDKNRLKQLAGIKESVFFPGVDPEDSGMPEVDPKQKAIDILEQLRSDGYDPFDIVKMLEFALNRARQEARS